MAKTGNPRHGSMQFWPRKRAKKETPRVRYFNDNQKEVKPLGFAGYKVSMTHALVTDNQKTSKTKGEDIFMPLTIIECPALKVMGIRFYKKEERKLLVASEILSDKLDKELSRKVSLPKKNKGSEAKEFDDIVLLVYTNPKSTSLAKKRPEVFELPLSGNKDEKLSFAKEKLGKEILITDVFKEGDNIDLHAVTTGKGYQGPVKRFGVSLRASKSEKTKRGPGSLGSWCGQGHMMYRIAYAGRMGYHLRTQYNNYIIKIDEKPKNPVAGFKHYGLIKNPCIMIKGSIPGPVKRLIRFNFAIRPKKEAIEAPQVAYLNIK